MDTREVILQAALGVYAHHGFRGATTRRIADAAGVNEVTIFRHFGSKEALLVEALQRMGKMDQLPPLPEEPTDPEAELTEWAIGQHAHLRERSSMIRTCMGELDERPDLCGPASTHPRLAFQQLCAYLRRLRESGFARADSEESVAAAMLIGSLFADAMGRDMMPEMFPRLDDAPRKYVSMLLRGITSDAGTAVPDATGATTL